MPLRHWFRVTTAVALLASTCAGSVGCSKPPADVPPQPSADVTPPPPPTPPKCEAISEKCDAKVETRAKVANSDLVFAPVAGWIYAQQSSATIAQSNELGAAVGLVGVDLDPKDPRKAAAAKDAGLNELLKQLGLGPLKAKVAWKHPEQTKQIGGFALHLWQVEKGGTRAQKKGDLLVVALEVSDAKALVGLGFVPDDDKTGADVSIMKAIESIGKAP